MMTPAKIESLKAFGILIGNFDGVHLGHQSLIDNFIKTCGERKITPVLYTFSPHPYHFFHDSKSPFIILDNNKKYLKLKEVGIKNVYEIEFDENLQKMSPEEFINKYLLSNSNLKLVYLGHDFRLGKGKIDSRELIRTMTKNMDIEIIESKSFKLNDQIVSSSAIRKLIKEGNDFDLIEKFLGERYIIDGTIVKGAGLGSTKLVPTINIDPITGLIYPSAGVYISEIEIQGQVYPSVTNIGIKPTVSNAEIVNIETHLLYNNILIENKIIKINLFRKIRAEIKFSSISLLKEQIEKDINQAKNYFRLRSNVKLGLIGKNIAHSQSQQIYEELLEKAVDYTLFDVEENELPDLKTIMKSGFLGISITSPYKNKYLKDISIVNEADTSINVIKFEKNKFIATNTDRLAISEILDRYIKQKIGKIIILGNGAMATIVEEEARKRISHIVLLSRQNESLDSLEKIVINENKNTLIVNCCSRSYNLPNISDIDLNIWDLNYDHTHNANTFNNSRANYIDGVEMLRLQAKYALSFWNLSKD